MRRPNARKPIGRHPEKTHKMDSLKLQMRPTARSTSLFPRNPKSPGSKLLTITVVSASLLALFLFYLFFRKEAENVFERKYGIIIDGGSTGSRVHVFHYGKKDGTRSLDFGENGLVSMRVNPGLSSYSDDPESAGGSLEELIEFGKSKVPRKFWMETEIRLMATAGLRMLEKSVQERILASCRTVLTLSGFKFKDEWASVISGSDEGLYAWIVANYALGTLGGDPLETTGVIELGGASAQITFVSKEPIPSEFSHMVKFGNVTYNLYSHSFLNFGQNVAHDSLRESLALGELSTRSSMKRILKDPCSPKGYSRNEYPGSLTAKNTYASALQPGGNFTECRAAALMLLQKGKDKCLYQHCNLGPNSVPRLNGRFLATENFFHTSKFFGLQSRAFLSDLMMAGQEFCEEDWSVLRKRYQPLDDDDLLRYCFSSAYIVALLHDSLGIALDDERIEIANQVGDIPLDWALGAFILQSTADVDEHSGWNGMLTDGSSMVRLLIVLSIMLLFLAWFLSKCRKPQLKTIYDLEKGRYIVTRVTR